jgi:hypothetical protein
MRMRMLLINLRQGEKRRFLTILPLFSHTIRHCMLFRKFNNIY